MTMWHVVTSWFSFFATIIWYLLLFLILLTVTLTIIGAVQYHKRKRANRELLRQRSAVAAGSRDLLMPQPSLSTHGNSNGSSHRDRNNNGVRRTSSQSNLTQLTPANSSAGGPSSDKNHRSRSHHHHNEGGDDAILLSEDGVSDHLDDNTRNRDTTTKRSSKSSSSRSSKIPLHSSKKRHLRKSIDVDNGTSSSGAALSSIASSPATSPRHSAQGHPHHPDTSRVSSTESHGSTVSSQPDAESASDTESSVGDNKGTTANTNDPRSFTWSLDSTNGPAIRSAAALRDPLSGIHKPAITSSSDATPNLPSRHLSSASRTLLRMCPEIQPEQLLPHAYTNVVPSTIQNSAASSRMTTPIKITRPAQNDATTRSINSSSSPSTSLYNPSSTPLLSPLPPSRVTSSNLIYTQLLALITHAHTQRILPYLSSLLHSFLTSEFEHGSITAVQYEVLQGVMRKEKMEDEEMEQTGESREISRQQLLELVLDITTQARKTAGVPRKSEAARRLSSAVSPLPSAASSTTVPAAASSSSMLTSNPSTSPVAPIIPSLPSLPPVPQIVLPSFHAPFAVAATTSSSLSTPAVPTALSHAELADLLLRRNLLNSPRDTLAWIQQVHSSHQTDAQRNDRSHQQQPATVALVPLQQQQSQLPHVLPSDMYTMMQDIHQLLKQQQQQQSTTQQSSNTNYSAEGNVSSTPARPIAESMSTSSSSSSHLPPSSPRTPRPSRPELARAQTLSAFMPSRNGMSNGTPASSSSNETSLFATPAQVATPPITQLEPPQIEHVSLDQVVELHSTEPQQQPPRSTSLLQRPSLVRPASIPVPLRISQSPSNSNQVSTYQYPSDPASPSIASARSLRPAVKFVFDEIQKPIGNGIGLPGSSPHQRSSSQLASAVATPTHRSSPLVQALTSVSRTTPPSPAASIMSLTVRSDDRAHYQNGLVQQQQQQQQQYQSHQQPPLPQHPASNSSSTYSSQLNSPAHTNGKNVNQIFTPSPGSISAVQMQQQQQQQQPSPSHPPPPYVPRPNLSPSTSLTNVNTTSSSTTRLSPVPISLPPRSPRSPIRKYSSATLPQFPPLGDSSLSHLIPGLANGNGNGNGNGAGSDRGGSGIGGGSNGHSPRRDHAHVRTSSKDYQTFPPKKRGGSRDNIAISNNSIYLAGSSSSASSNITTLGISPKDEIDSQGIIKMMKNLGRDEMKQGE